MNLRILTAALAAAFVISVTAGADATPRHRHHRAASGEAGQDVGGRPAACYRFPATRGLWCGCASALEVGIDNHDGFWNLARNWYHYMAAAPAAAGMAATKVWHVMILREHIEGTRWRVYDPNNGNRALVRVVDIRGWRIVDPHNSRRRIASR